MMIDDTGWMTTRSEILDLEEALRQAELGPAPAFFEEHLADDVVFAGPAGQPPMTKAFVVQAHQPGAPAVHARRDERHADRRARRRSSSTPRGF
jgi:hypothetical protein